MGAPPQQGPLQHYAMNCFSPCNGAGTCASYCGTGNACCQKGQVSDPAVCEGVNFWPVVGFHTCVQPTYLVYMADKWCGGDALSDNWNTDEDVSTLKACQSICDQSSACMYLVFGADTSRQKNRCATFRSCATTYEYLD